MPASSMTPAIAVTRPMPVTAPRAAAAGGLQGVARLTGQTAGVVAMTLLFSSTSLDIAPRLGLAFGAVMTLAAGLLSTLHVRTIAKAP